VGGGTAIQAIFEPLKPFLEKERNLRLELSDKGPEASFLDLQAGLLEAAVAGTSMESWLDLMRSKGQAVGKVTDYTSIQIGEDRLSVLVNPDVVTDLDVLAMDFNLQKIRWMFTGKVANWKEVGGPDMPVVVVLGRKTAGANKEFQEKVLSGAAFAKDAMEVGTVPEIIEALIKTRGAIGIGPLAVTSNSKIWSPAQAPTLTRPFTLLMRKDLGPEQKKAVADMVAYILGPGKAHLAH
jgi:phosphate transport system substrate-binding protein